MQRHHLAFFRLITNTNTKAKYQILAILVRVEEVAQIRTRLYFNQLIDKSITTSIITMLMEVEDKEIFLLAQDKEEAIWARKLLKYLKLDLKELLKILICRIKRTILICLKKIIITIKNRAIWTKEATLHWRLYTRISLAERLPLSSMDMERKRQEEIQMLVIWINPTTPICLIHTLKDSTMNLVLKCIILKVAHQEEMVLGKIPRTEMAVP